MPRIYRLKIDKCGKVCPSHHAGDEWGKPSMCWNKKCKKPRPIETGEIVNGFPLFCPLGIVRGIR